MRRGVLRDPLDVVDGVGSAHSDEQVSALRRRSRACRVRRACRSPRT